MKEYNKTLFTGITADKVESVPGRGGEEGDVSSRKEYVPDGSAETEQKKEALGTKETQAKKVRKWAQIRVSLSAIESTMSLRIKERNKMKDEQIGQNHLPSIEEGFFKEEPSCNLLLDDSGNESLEASAAAHGISPEPFFPWKEELECLVRGGLPKALRGEVHLILLNYRFCVLVLERIIFCFIIILTLQIYRYGKHLLV